MKIADTFLLKTVVREPHIWVVAYYQDLTAVTFNFTTRQASSVDLTCTIGPAEYSELRHESVMRSSTVGYGRVRKVYGSLKIMGLADL